MQDHSLVKIPGLTEKMLRFADQAAEQLPLCRTNLACLLEFDSSEQEKPSLEEIRNLIQTKLSELPPLRHFLDEKEGDFQWRSYMPDLEKCITEKQIASQDFKNEIQTLLAGKLPCHHPWKLSYLSDPHSQRFSLLWCVRHEIMDAGGISAMLKILFGKENSASVKSSPSTPTEKFVTPHFSDTEAQLFFHNVPSTPNRQLIALQMPSRLLPMIGKFFGVSGNDIYLKAMGDALWKWRKQNNNPLSEKTKLPMVMPINLRPADDFGVGNRFYLGRADLNADFSLEKISKTMDIFRQEGVKEQLAKNYAENADMAVEQFPTGECQSAACSSFRITQELAWGHAPLKRIMYAFNTFVQGMPFYSILSTYEPKHTPQKDSVSTLFCALDAGIENFSKIPDFWKEAVYELAAMAKIDRHTFGEDPIKLFC